MGMCFFLPQHPFNLCHRKTRWTTLVDNVSLQNMSFGDLELHGHSNLFLFVVN
jgi:hypothetical protein